MKCLLAPSFFAILVACGGTIEGQNKKTEPPLCSQATTCNDGDTCRMPVAGCPGEAPSEFSCSCSNGSFACPDIGRICRQPPKPPGWYEVCGIAGKVNDGEWCPPEAKGDTCESYRQTTCEEPLPKVECTCDGTKFVCGLPPTCPTPSADAGQAD